MIHNDINNDININNYVSSNLLVNQQRKKELGEVMTPLELVEQMLDALPVSVWTNPTLRWFEPTCGSGHFMICVFRRLKLHFDASHIIQNMLFMVDINPDNVAKCKSLFGESCNAYCSDILTYDGGMFDIIVGNVPFQQVSLMGGKSKLYEKITLRCLGMLSAGGFMSLLVPDNLFSAGNKTYKQMINHNIHTLNVCKSNQQYFPKIQQYICYFLLQKSSHLQQRQDTEITCNNGDKIYVCLTDRPINPVRDWTLETERLTVKYISATLNGAVYVRGRPVSEYVGEKYKVIYTPTKWLMTDDSSIPGIGIKKVVIFSISVHFNFTIDWAGECGVGPNAFYIPIKDDADGMRWKQFLESPEYLMLATSCRTCRQFIKNAFVQHIHFTIRDQVAHSKVEQNDNL